MVVNCCWVVTLKGRRWTDGHVITRGVVVSPCSFRSLGDDLRKLSLRATPPAPTWDTEDSRDGRSLNTLRNLPKCTCFLVKTVERRSKKVVWVVPRLRSNKDNDKGIQSTPTGNYGSWPKTTKCHSCRNTSEWFLPRPVSRTTDPDPNPLPPWYPVPKKRVGTYFLHR